MAKETAFQGGVTATDAFVDSLLSMAGGGIAAPLEACARMCLVDYMGCLAAGLAEAGDQIGNLRKSFGDSPLGDALAMGMAAHFVELDDGHRYGMLHLGAPVISALLAAARQEQVSAQDFLAGIVLGYEAAIRLARAVQPSCKLKGYHATGVCGTVGAAAGIAFALGFSRAALKSALSAAATGAAGLLEMIEGDTQLKPYNAGRAAMDGLAAAYAGRAGFRPPADAIGGRRGLLAVIADEAHPESLLGEGRAAIETIYRKPYAACRHCHAPIEAALGIAAENDVHPADVARIIVDTYRLAVAGHDHVEIDGANSAKMSIPFSVAAAIAMRSGGMDAFRGKAVLDTTVLDLARRVAVRENGAFTALCPEKRVASVTVELKDGRLLSKRVDYPKGEPENPISDEELRAKFRSLADCGGLSRAAAEEVLRQMSHPDFDTRHIADAIWSRHEMS